MKTKQLQIELKEKEERLEELQDTSLHPCSLSVQLEVEDQIQEIKDRIVAEIFNQ